MLALNRTYPTALMLAATALLNACSSSASREIKPMQRIENNSGTTQTVQYRKACGHSCAAAYASLNLAADETATVTFGAYSEGLKGNSNGGSLLEPVRLEFSPPADGIHICEQSPFDSSRYAEGILPPAQYALRQGEDACPVTFADVGSVAE